MLPETGWPKLTIVTSRKLAHRRPPLNLTFQEAALFSRAGTVGWMSLECKSSHSAPLHRLPIPPAAPAQGPSGILPGGDNSALRLAEIKLASGIRMLLRASRQTWLGFAPHSCPPRPLSPVMVMFAVSRQTAQPTHLCSFPRHSTPRQWCRE